MLASLGGFEETKKEVVATNGNNIEEEDDNLDSRVSDMADTLQEWRVKNKQTQH